MMNRPDGSLKGADLAPILQKLKRVNEGVAKAFPGESTERQPVHTVYGGAHVFSADSAKKLGAVALAALNEYASGAAALSYTNAERASDFGIELEVRKRLDGLAPALGPFTVFANTTVMRSRITPGDASLTSTERPLVGQAAYVVNAGLTYALSGWSGTVLYNVVGRRVAEAGFQPYPDVYEEPRSQLDASLQVPVAGDLAFRLDGKNLLDAKTRFTQGAVDRLSYRTGRVVSFGAQWKP